MIIAILTGCQRIFQSGEVPRDDFCDRIEKHLQPVGQNAVWSIQIREFPGGEVIYQRNPSNCLLPASNAKLFTTAAALKFLGPDYRFTTLLLSDGEADSTGILYGDLYVVGGGDPAFSGMFHDGNPSIVFSRWAEILHDLGIEGTAGNIVGVDTFFTSPSRESSWEWGDLRFAFAASSSALCFNDNCLDLHLFSPGSGEKIVPDWNPPIDDLTVINKLEIAPQGESGKIYWDWIYPDSVLSLSGSITPADSEKIRIPVQNPPRYFLKSIKAVFEGEGLSLDGELMLMNHSSSGEDSVSLDTLIVHHSPPLSEIVKAINTESVNLYAEQLLRTMGRELYHDGSPETGIDAIYALLDSALINPECVHLVDGSGLSRHNWVSADAVVDLLEYCLTADFADIFITSLARYGEGTLEERSYRGEKHFNISSKTGSMSGVRAHSGYIIADGNEYIFALICNNYSCSGGVVEDAFDNVIAEICRK